MTTPSAGVALHPEMSFRTALGKNSLKNVDLETLERIEQSAELDYYPDPAAPGILYTLVQNHMKSKPNSRIFDDRYGLVCVRILIRLIQVLVCATSNTLAYVKSNLGTAAANANILAFLSGHTADVILGQMGQAQNRNSLKTISSLLGQSKDLFSHEHLSELLDILFRDRKSFFVLYKSGALQGVVLLLYMIWVQISGIMSGMNPFLMTRLRDLLFRCYLVTSTGERETIRLLCIQMYQIHDGHEDESEPFDIDDSRTIAHAYNQCIMFPEDTDPLSGMRLDMYRYLLEFVSDLTVFPMPEELPLVTRAAIERLWMAFDTEEVELLITPDDRRSQVLYYFGDLSYALTQLLKRFPPKQSPRPLVESLAHSDWPEAMARFMLLCFRKSKILTFPTYTMRHLPAVTTIVAHFGPISHEIFVNTYPDWVKILGYLRVLLGSRRPDNPSITHIYEVMEEWMRWGVAVGFEQSPFETDCTYPRCVGGLSTRVCKRCGVARYCSLKCQHTDWLSPFPDSHRRHCQVKKGVNF